jgi:ribosomal protein S18 acetylase RimI-like enzyme
MIVRAADESDIPFIARIVFEAEATGAEITSYEKMFLMPRAELEAAFAKGLIDSPAGHALSWRNFFIAESEGQRAGALSAYIEGSNGDSSHLTTAFLMQVIPRNILSNGFKLLRANTDVSLAKKPGTLQIDCVATLPEFRGKGALKALISFVTEQAKKQGANEAEIQVWKQNAGAVKAYESLGFVISQEALSAAWPGNGKLILTKQI